MPKTTVLLYPGVSVRAQHWGTRCSSCGENRAFSSRTTPQQQVTPSHARPNKCAVGCRYDFHVNISAPYALACMQMYSHK